MELCTQGQTFVFNGNVPDLLLVRLPQGNKFKFEIYRENAREKRKKKQKLNYEK